MVQSSLLSQDHQLWVAESLGPRSGFQLLERRPFHAQSSSIELVRIMVHIWHLTLIIQVSSLQMDVTPLNFNISIDVNTKH